MKARKEPFQAFIKECTIRFGIKRGPCRSHFTGNWPDNKPHVVLCEPDQLIDQLKKEISVDERRKDFENKGMMLALEALDRFFKTNNTVSLAEALKIFSTISLAKDSREKVKLKAQEVLQNNPKYNEWADASIYGDNPVTVIEDVTKDTREHDQGAAGELRKEITEGKE